VALPVYATLAFRKTQLTALGQ